MICIVAGAIQFVVVDASTNDLVDVVAESKHLSKREFYRAYVIVDPNVAG